MSVDLAKDSLEEGEVESADDAEIENQMKSKIKSAQNNDEDCIVRDGKVKYPTRKSKKKRKKRRLSPLNNSNSKKCSSYPKKSSISTKIDEYEALYIKSNGTGNGNRLAKPLPAIPDEYGKQVAYFDQSTFYDEINSIEYARMSTDERREFRRRTDLRNRSKHTDGVKDSKKTTITEEICNYSLVGNCRLNQCNREHVNEFRGQRQFELCHYFTIGSCTKGDRCPFMHSEFPCRFYYLGVKTHDQSKCRLFHGKPLSETWRNILINHIEKNPKNGLPPMDRQRIISQMQEQHLNLVKLYGEPDNIPTDDFKSIQNLVGIITAQQMERLMVSGIRNIDQISQLTVLQLNDIGLSINQIHEIQMNALNIQKLGLKNQPQKEDKNLVGQSGDLLSDTFDGLNRKQDVDMRVMSYGNSVVPVTADAPVREVQFYAESIMEQPAETVECPTSGDESEPRLVINEDVSQTEDEENANDINDDRESPPFLGFIL